MGPDERFVNERQLLVETQRIGRARARKLFLENKQRRKALEERQKRWDLMEKQLRENILQQRRQQIKDATNRFQRAHLPPSEREQQTFRRNVPNIEDALIQIQGITSSHKQEFSSRTLISSPKCSVVPKYPFHQTLSTVERGLTYLKSNSQTQKTQDEQQQHSGGLQEHNTSVGCNSESISSKDSLDSEEPNINRIPINTSNHNQQDSSPPFFLHSNKPHPNQKNQSDLGPPSSLSVMMLLADNLSPKRTHHESKHSPEVTDGLNNAIHKFTKASLRFTSEIQPSLESCNFLALYDIEANPKHCGEEAKGNSPSDNVTVIAIKTASSSTAHESSPKQEALLDFRKQMFQDDVQFKHQTPTEIMLSQKSGNYKDILFGAPPDPHIFLSDTSVVSLSQKQTLHFSRKEEPSAYINNLNKVLNTEMKNEKSIISASQQHTCMSNIQPDHPKSVKCPEEKEQRVETSHKEFKVCKVNFIKGILKKQSKCLSQDTTSVYGFGHLTFSKHLALALRDSIELTRGKTKQVESNNTVKKKLRWFDEIHLEKQDKEQSINVMKQKKDKSSSLCCSQSSPDDHQLISTTVTGASKPGPGMAYQASADYHFTKQAWADAGVQVSLPQDVVNVPKSCTRAGGPKVPWRERNARVGVPSRKGTVIRPQSVIEVNQIAKTHGKIMAPRPPPRIEIIKEKMPSIAKTPSGMDHTSVNHNQAPPTQMPHKDNTKLFFSPNTYFQANDNAVHTVVEPSYCCPVREKSTHGTSSSGHQEAQHCSGRGEVAYSKKGLCLECTPTDEEISELWHGVRSALANKEELVFRKQVQQSRPTEGKISVAQHQQQSGSGSKRFLQPSETTNPVKPSSSSHEMTFPQEGLDGATYLADGSVEHQQKQGVVVVQMQRTGMMQKPNQQQGITAISVEEQKILHSLERLDHKLHCVWEHVEDNTGNSDYCAPSMREGKVMNPYKDCGASANSQSQNQRTF
ncbi:centrosomal protein of 126 kDa [Thalassophryne amazonica]|uniref:centrosomal protein of 126 kDa n=1 Tax=Thalassophryne amazonica TaxID=390379 RepID=UPI0014722EFB|nr:centrosomal protein of 126 kDa [Thalassophryne amazonica]